MVPFTTFRNHLNSMEHRNQRLQLRQASVHADMIKERCKGVGIEFARLQDADFILYRSGVIRFGQVWWPETLLFIYGRAGPFEMFARCKSTSYFNRARQLIGVRDKQHLLEVVE